MPTGKRASMREGPLASLFRKTAEDTAGEHDASAEEAPRQEPRNPEIEAAQVPSPAAEAEPAEEERHIPSPQERLRSAFSADIPQNVMERPGPAASPGPVAARAPQPDVYARPERVGEA